MLRVRALQLQRSSFTDYWRTLDPDIKGGLTGSAGGRCQRPEVSRPQAGLFVIFVNSVEKVRCTLSVSTRRCLWRRSDGRRIGAWLLYCNMCSAIVKWKLSEPGFEGFQGSKE